MAVFDNVLYPAKDFAYGIIATAPSPATTGTSFVLTAGQGALFNAPATEGSFRVWIWPAGVNPTAANAEEVEVTAISTDTFTITRHVGGIVRTVVIGDQVAINLGMSYYNKILRALVDGVVEDVLLPGASFTRSSDTQFVTPGDKTLFYTAGRILRINDTGTYSVHTVVSSSYGAPNTTVIVKGTALPANLTNIFIGIQPKGKTNTSSDVETFTNKTISSGSVLDANASDNFSLYGMARQAIINGNLDVWLKGISFTNPASALVTAAKIGVTQSMASPPTNVIHTRQLLTSGDIPGSFYHYRIAPDGAGSINNGEYYFIGFGSTNATRHLAGNGKKITLSFYARSSIADKRIGLELRQLYGSGGSPSTGEVIKGPIIALTSSWVKYTHTFTTNTLASKTFGTNNDDGLGINFWEAWGADLVSTFFSTGTGAEGFVGSGNIDIAQVQVCAGDVALPFQPKTYLEEYRNCLGFDTGWIPYLDIVPTLGTADDPIFPLVFAGLDLTSKFWPGMKVKWTQNGTVRYGIIHAQAFSTNTTLQVYGGANYNVDNTTTYPITDFCYSPMRAPQGFPLDPTGWDILYSNAGDLDAGAVTANNWTNFGGLSQSVPLGVWLPEYSCCFEPYDGATTSFAVWSTLSTANNSESDVDSTYFNNGPVVATPYIPMMKKKSAPIVLAAKTTYYLNGKANRNTSSNFLVRGGTMPTKIIFRNVYL